MTKLLNHINTYQSEADYQNDKSKNFPNVSYIVENDNVLFVKEKTDYSNDYLTFVALEDATFKLTYNAVNYSLDDGETWTLLRSGTASPTVTAGNKIMWKGELTPTSSNGIGKFSATANFNVQGNVMSLLFGDDFTNKTDLTGKDYAFYHLFYQNTNIKSAKNLILPATKLANRCYLEMFNGCTGLTSAPKLPATTLASYCYSYMFDSCTSLVNAPQLPATALATYCYSNMFRNCKSLTTAPELPATRLTSVCYGAMFYGCKNINYIKAMFTTTPSDSYTYNWLTGVASKGTFVKNSAATWNVTGISGIPSGWTVVTE